MSLIKKIAVFSVLLLIVPGILAACNSDKSSGGSSKKVELTWLVTTSPVRDEWYKQMVKDFENEHSNIRIELVTIPQDEMDQRLSTMLAGGNTPDVWSPNWSRSGFGTYQRRNTLLDLTDYVENDAEFLKGIPDELMELYKVQGKTYGIPMLSMGTYIFYNKDIFDEVGVDYPTTDWEDVSWDWDELVAKAKKLTKDIENPNEAIYGLYNPETPNRFSWFFGGDFFTKEAYETGEMGEPQALKNPKNKESIQANYDLIYKHKVSPNPSQVEAISQISDPFLSGRVAMAINGGWGVMSYLPAEFNWGFAALPFAGEDRQVPMYVDPWTIGKGSKHPDEAWEFIKFITDPEGGGYQQMVDLNNPPVYEKLNDEYYETIAGYENIIMTKEQIKEVIEGAMKYGRAADNHKISDFSNIRTIINQNIDAVYNNNKDIDKALEEIDQGLRNLND